MPTSREVVANKALSGIEMKELMRQDFEKGLQNSGFLTDYAAYGRCAWELIIRLHTDNPYMPTQETKIASAPLGKNVVALDPESAAMEAPPLANTSTDAVIETTRVGRTINSPNAERLRAGLPVAMNVRQQDGTTSQQQVTYPPDATVGEGEVAVTSEATTVGGQKIDKVAMAEVPGVGDPT
jgi:hypothetical protein